MFAPRFGGFGGGEGLAAATAASASDVVGGGFGGGEGRTASGEGTEGGRGVGEMAGGSSSGGELERRNWGKGFFCQVAFVSSFSVFLSLSDRYRGALAFLRGGSGSERKRPRPPAELSDIRRSRRRC